MEFSVPLIPATLIKRYKRFLADMRLEDGSVITAHCANPGSMLGLSDPGSRCWLSRSHDPRRKLKYSWELLEVDAGRGPCMVGINTSHPNTLVAQAVEAGAIEPLAGYDSLRREVRYGRNSRIDLLLEGAGRPACYVEIKNVHLLRRPGLAEFPDSVTARGTKHLGELGDMAEAGHRAVMVYLVQRADADRMALARDIDPAYGAAFDNARTRGVEAFALACDITPERIVIARRIELLDGLRTVNVALH